MSITQERIHKMIDDARKKKRVKEQHGFQWLLDNFEPVKLAVWIQNQNELRLSKELFDAFQTRKTFINFFEGRKLYRFNSFPNHLWRLLKSIKALKVLTGQDGKKLRLHQVQEMCDNTFNYFLGRRARRENRAVAQDARTKRLQPSDDVIVKLATKRLPVYLIPDTLKADRVPDLEEKDGKSYLRVKWDFKQDAAGGQRLIIKLNNW